MKAFISKNTSDIKGRVDACLRPCFKLFPIPFRTAQMQVMQQIFLVDETYSFAIEEFVPPNRN